MKYFICNHRLEGNFQTNGPTQYICKIGLNISCHNYDEMSFTYHKKITDYKWKMPNTYSPLMS